MISVLRFADGAVHRVDPRDLPPEPGGDLWCDLERGELPPADAQGGGLGRWLSTLHPLAVRRLRHPTRSILDNPEPGCAHVRLEPASGDARLDLLVGSHFALTVRDGAWPARERLWQELLEGSRPAQGLELAIYELLARLVEDIRRRADELDRRAEGVAMRLVRLRERHILREIVEVRRRALHLRGVVLPDETALRLLASGGSASPVSDQARPYLGELHQELRAVLAEVEEVRSTMGEAVEGYMSVQSTEMNRVMQLFTILAVVLMPPALVAAIYGMNFKIPEYHWPLGYFWALGLMVVISAGLYLWLHRRGWL